MKIPNIAKNISEKIHGKAVVSLHKHPQTEGTIIAARWDMSNGVWAFSRNLSPCEIHDEGFPSLCKQYIESANSFFYRDVLQVLPS